MRPIIRTNIFLVILVTLLSASGANARGFSKNIVVVLAGTGQGYPGDERFEQIGQDVPMGGVTCFDMDLIDAKTDRVIGSGSDCLSGMGGDPDNGISLTATTFFHFPGGTLVSQGLVTVQPKLHGLDGFTHITGAVPAPSKNNVIYGDGRFKRAAGSVRLSGIVNLDELFTVGKITFDCVFIIDLWKKRHRWN